MYEYFHQIFIKRKLKKEQQRKMIPREKLMHIRIYLCIIRGIQAGKECQALFLCAQMASYKINRFLCDRHRSNIDPARIQSMSIRWSSNNEY